MCLAAQPFVAKLAHGGLAKRLAGRALLDAADDFPAYCFGENLVAA